MNDMKRVALTNRFTTAVSGSIKASRMWKPAKVPKRGRIETK